MDELVCLNGSFVPRGRALVSVADRGFLYGYGLFETILVRAGRPVLLAGHCRRLAAGCCRLDLPPPCGEERLAALVLETVGRNRVEDGVVRLTWTAGEDAGNLVIAVRPLTYGPADYQRGFKACLAGVPRHEKSPLTGLKTLNYLENLLARQRARRQGRDEAVFLNTAGALAEGSASNIFLVRGERLVTPAPDQGILPGIVRGLVLELAAEAGLRPEERRVEPGELARAGEAFLTNSLLGVMPLAEVGGQKVGDGRPGERTRRLRRLVEESFREGAVREIRNERP